MISMKESLIGGSTLNGIAEGVAEHLVLETSSSDTSKVVLGPIRRPTALIKDDVENLGYCGIAVPNATGTDRIQEFNVVRQADVLATIRAIFPPAGQLSLPKFTSEVLYQASAARPIGSVDMHVVYADSLGQSLPRTTSVFLANRLSVITPSNESVDIEPGNLSSGTYANINAVIYRLSDGAYAGRAMNIFQDNPIGTYTVTTTALDIDDDGSGVVGSITPGTQLEISPAFLLNGSWVRINTTITHTVTSTGAIRVNGGRTQIVKGSIDKDMPSGFYYRTVGDTTWRYVDSPTVGSITLTADDQGVVGAATLAPTSISVNNIANVSTTLNITLRDSMDVSDFGIVLYRGTDTILLRSDVGLSVSGLSIDIETQPVQNTAAITVTLSDTVPPLETFTIPADQIYSSTAPIAVDVDIGSNAYATTYKVYVTFRAGGWKPASAAFNTPYLVYEGADNNYLWTGTTITQQALPTVNTTDSYPATYTGRMELDILAGGTLLQLQPGDMITYAGRTAVITATVPAVVT